MSESQNLFRLTTDKGSDPGGGGAETGGCDFLQSTLFKLFNPHFKKISHFLGFLRN